MTEVKLKRAGIPFLGAIAVHYWFVTRDTEGATIRWEVWHRKEAGGYSSGHLYQNLLAPEADLGGTATETVRSWDGEMAERILNTLHESWNSYPYKNRYLPIPGPNSNTYIAWILREANVSFALSWKGWGKHF